jgi:superfamily II RNA helicase
MNTFVKFHTGEYVGEYPKEYFKFSYPLDHFQLYGCKAIADNENLLVTAHTGSGKTALALYAIAKTLSEGKKVIYTSPIKTLSNQKYAEFSEHFKSIGILTGDIKINPLGDLLIMTAEILNNSLLKNSITYEWNFNPQEIGCVILDEVHYINNKERGKVWEEIIINLDPKIQLVMLSATITGAEEMASWIGKLKKINCHLTTTLKRPVPLQHGIWWDGEISYFLYGDKNWKIGVWQEKCNQINKFYKNKSFTLNNFFSCIKYLYNNNMTPANIFLLNRKLLEEYAKKIPLYLVDSEESSKIQNIWEKKLHKYNNLYNKTKEWNELYLLVSKGIGIHHSGMIPVLKEIVEILYSEGLIKILLATETFAMGVNMPTKTVVFFNIDKFDGTGIKRILKPEEYGQMAGRAGRRGKDTIGHIIILPSINFIDETTAKNMILSKPQKIISKFSLDAVFLLKELSFILANHELLNENIIEVITNKVLNKCNNSLFNYQNLSIINKLDNEYSDIKLKLEESNIPNEIIEIYIEIQEIEKKLKPDGIIKLSPKLEKKLLGDKNMLIKKIENYDKIQINQYVDYKKNLNNIEYILNTDYNKINISTQINIILNFLKESNYLDEKYKLTKIGKLISEINECNPFLLSELINSDNFNDLDFSEIVALCSIFINENKIKVDVYISDLNCSDNCKKILYHIEKVINIYSIKETELNNLLPYPCWLDWSINLSMFNIVKNWSEGISWHLITNDYNSFQGNFIKTILRITNLLNNIEIIAKTFNNIKIINKLADFPEKLIRDIVITDSLHINI